MIPRIVSVCLAAATLVPAPGAAQPTEHPRVQEALGLLETWVSAKRDFDRMPGVSMAVVHDQEVLWSKGFGKAHKGTGVPATPATLYSICSISKLFTSIALLRLRDQGKLRLDDPVHKHLDWFDIGSSLEFEAPVTVEGILTHSSGLPRESDFPYWTGPDHPFPTREQIQKRVAEQEMLYDSYRYFQYSNLGLTLAGEIVSAVSGEDFDDHVRRHVLEPLGMTSTFTDHPDEHRGGRFATGYTAVRRDGSREAVPPYAVRGISPAAGFVSSVEDLSTFASWQFRTLAGKDDRVLPRNTLREMHRVHFTDPGWRTTWGLGFSVWKNDDDETFVGHGGYCPGYQSHLLIHPRSRLAAVFMTNTNGVNSRRFTQTAYDIVSEALEEAERGDPAPLEPKLKAYVGRYTDWLAGESAVLPWEGGLAVLSLPTDDPLESLMKLEHIEGDRFRRVRDDGDLGEAILFERGDDGRVIRMWRHSNPQDRAPGD